MLIYREVLVATVTSRAVPAIASTLITHPTHTLIHSHAPIPQSHGPSRAHGTVELPEQVLICAGHTKRACISGHPG
jgi:hypothetical protein